MGSFIVDNLAKDCASACIYIEAGRSLPSDAGLPGIIFGLSQLKLLIEHYVNALWNCSFVASKTGRDYRDMVHSINHRWLVSNNNPTLNKNWNRIRMLRVPLNFYKAKIGKQACGLCNHCKVDETVSHYILDCVSDGAPCNKIKKYLTDKGIVAGNLEALLNLPDILNIISNCMKLRQ
jgi:hypothetical protein